MSVGVLPNDLPPQSRTRPERDGAEVAAALRPHEAGAAAAARAFEERRRANAAEIADLDGLRENQAAVLADLEVPLSLFGAVRNLVLKNRDLKEENTSKSNEIYKSCTLRNSSASLQAQNLQI